jgi:lipid-A-disaccharide synthase
LDTVTASGTRSAFLQNHAIPTGRPVIGIMPGSRRKEIATLLPVFLEAAALIQKEIPEAVFLLPQAPSVSAELLFQHGLGDCGLEVKIIAEERYNLMAACDAVMAASGTITLELAILNIPMLVAYRVSPLSHFIGKRLIDVPHISLVNLVAGREVIPELVQQEVTPEKIAGSLVRMIRDQTYRRNILSGLAEVKKLLGEKGASKRAARIGYDLIHPRQAGG